MSLRKCNRRTHLSKAVVEEPVMLIKFPCVDLVLTFRLQLGYQRCLEVSVKLSTNSAMGGAM